MCEHVFVSNIVLEVLSIAESIGLGYSLVGLLATGSTRDNHILILVLNHLWRHSVVIVLSRVLLWSFTLVVHIILLERIVLSIVLTLEILRGLVEYLRICLLEFGEDFDSMLSPRELSRELLDSFKDTSSHVVIRDDSDYLLEYVIAKLIED
jgi:hypothetical protein